VSDAAGPVRPARARSLVVANPRSMTPADGLAAARTGQVGVLALLAAAATWFAVTRLHAVARTTSSRGLGTAPLGAAPIGWREQVAATMTPWRNHNP